MAEEFCRKLLAAVIEMQKASGELLGQLAVDHKINKSSGITDPGKALANIVKQQSHLNNVQSLNYKCNESKIYDTSKTPPVPKTHIEILTIDKTLQHDLLFCLEGFPVSKPSKPNKKVKCYGACASSCKRKDYCCDSCRSCKQCNGNLTFTQQCSVFKLRKALEKDKSLRNLFSHLTLTVMEDFLNNGKPVFPDFPNVKKWDELCNEFVETMTSICDYMCDQNNFGNANVVILNVSQKKQKLDKLDRILNSNIKITCDMNLLMNLEQVLMEEQKISHDHITKIFAMFEKTITQEIRSMKGNSDIKCLPLIINIEKDTPFWKCGCVVDKPMFSAKDIAYNGRLSKLFLKSTKETLNDLYHVSVEDNRYRITDVKLKCANPPNKFTKSFKFTLTISDVGQVFPGELSNSISEKAINLAFNLTSNIEKELNTNFKRKIHVSLNYVSLGSLIISGTISRRLLSFSKQKQEQIATLIEEHAKRIFQCHNVKAEVLPTQIQEQPVVTSHEFQVCVAKIKPELAASINERLSDIVYRITENVKAEIHDEEKTKEKGMRFKKGADDCDLMMPLIPEKDEESSHHVYRSTNIRFDERLNDDASTSKQFTHPEKEKFKRKSYIESLKDCIILVGDKEEKSRLVERLIPDTTSPNVYHSADGQLLICDTPGIDPIPEAFEHMIQVAVAMNFHPFSGIIIVVKAESCSDIFIEKVRNYTERFLGDISGMLAVCVTHMNELTWGRGILKTRLVKELNAFVFSTSPEIAELKAICVKKPLHMKINSENFFKFFKISNNDLNILTTIRQEVVYLTEKMAIECETRSTDEAGPRIAKFEVWLKKEIVHAQKRVCEKHHLTGPTSRLVTGRDTANIAGHIANMTNQLRDVLLDVRIMASSFQYLDGLEMWKCPHCKSIWSQTASEKCDFPKCDHCGEATVWYKMEKVRLPLDIFPDSVNINTDDVELFPDEARATWSTLFNETLSSCQTNFDRGDAMIEKI